MVGTPYEAREGERLARRPTRTVIPSRGLRQRSGPGQSYGVDFRWEPKFASSDTTPGVDFRSSRSSRCRAREAPMDDKLGGSHVWRIACVPLDWRKSLGVEGLRAQAPMTLSGRQCGALDRLVELLATSENRGDIG